MAVLSREHGYLFVCSPRTGSTAIAFGVLVEQLDGRWCPEDRVVLPDGGVVRPKHSTVPQLRAAGLVTDHDLAGLLTFCAVRNPFDSLVTHYEACRTRYAGMIDRGEDVRAGSGVHDMSWVHDPGSTLAQDVASAVARDFPDWVRHRYLPSTWRGRLRVALSPSLPRPRHMYGAYLEDVDEVLRYESLQADLDRVLGMLGVDAVEIPRRNRTGSKRDYREYYDDRTRRLVGEVYARDLERFGYAF